jgi:hypothetical protein
MSILFSFLREIFCKQTPALSSPVGEAVELVGIFIFYRQRKKSA